MTPQEIVDSLTALKNKIGPYAYISLTMTSSSGGVSGSIYPDGVAAYGAAIYAGPFTTFEEALVGLEAEWAEHSAKFHHDTLRKMALEIINLTNLNGTCNAAGLRMKFPAAMIDLLGDQACTLAGEMASGAPFTIVDASGSNMPERAAA